MWIKSVQDRQRTKYCKQYFYATSISSSMKHSIEKMCDKLVIPTVQAIKRNADFYFMHGHLIFTWQSH